MRQAVKSDSRFREADDCHLIAAYAYIGDI